jgi:beta-lactamase regulating signal transducer with metallopeptidase domain
MNDRSALALYGAVVTMLLSLIAIVVTRLDAAHVLRSHADICRTPLFGGTPLPGIVALASLAYLGIRVTVSWIRSYRYTSSLPVVPAPAVVSRICRTMDIAVPVRVYRCDVPRAFCIGLIRPSIYLSSALVDILSADELEAVLLHEHYHARRFDNAVQTVMSSLSALLFLFPVLRDLEARYRLARETAADAYALARSGSSEALLGAFYRMSRTPGVPVYVTAFTSGDSLLYRVSRIRGASCRSPEVSARNVILTATTVLIISGVLAIPYEVSAMGSRQATGVQVCPGRSESLPAASYARP